MFNKPRTEHIAKLKQILKSFSEGKLNEKRLFGFVKIIWQTAIKLVCWDVLLFD